MKRDLLSVMLFAGWLLSGVACGAETCKSTVVGELVIQHFESKTFGDTQSLRVWLPPGYHDAANAQRHYPVLYMMDGQNLFDVCTTAFGHEWEIDETLTRLIGEGKLDPLIVVGIDSSKTRRSDEFIPFSDSLFGNAKETHGKLFPAFVVDEVMPLIGSAFRVKHGPTDTAIGGSSYGSVAALYALITRPSVFGMGLLESTSAQVGNGELMRLTQSLLVAPRRVSIGVGTNEIGNDSKSAAELGLTLAQLNGALPAASEQIANNLRTSATGGAQVKLVITPGAKHQEQAWAARFPDAIQFLFPKQTR